MAPRIEKGARISKRRSRAPLEACACEALVRLEAAAIAGVFSVAN
jgi:hypothetical protein